MLIQFYFWTLLSIGKRPLLGALKNRNSTSVESLPSSDPKIDCDFQMKLQNQEGELERLKQELTSQKVSIVQITAITKSLRV